MFVAEQAREQAAGRCERSSRRPLGRGVAEPHSRIRMPRSRKSSITPTCYLKNILRRSRQGTPKADPSSQYVSVIRPRPISVDTGKRPTPNLLGWGLIALILSTEIGLTPLTPTPNFFGYFGKFCNVSDLEFGFPPDYPCEIGLDRPRWGLSKYLV